MAEPESKFVLCRHDGVKVPALVARSALPHMPGWTPYRDVDDAPDLVVDDGPLDQPARNASHEEWVAYAISRGAEPTAAAASTRTQLITDHAVPDPETEEN